nr:hypothetical protein [Tanacetum cinerariifolium]
MKQLIPSPPLHVWREDIECKDSYDFNLDESTFLVTPLFDVNEDEYFTPGDDVELLLHRDLSTPIMSFVSILERFTNEPPVEENDDFFNLESKNVKWKKILYDGQIDDLMSKDRVFNLEIHDQFFSPTHVSLPFMDCHYIFFTCVVRILRHYFTYSVVSPFLISSGSDDLIQIRICSRLKISFEFVKDSSCSKEGQDTFENADSSSRVELIPSKIKYAIKVMMEPDIENMTFNEYLMYEGRNRDLMRNCTSRNRGACFKVALVRIRIWFGNIDHEDGELFYFPTFSDTNVFASGCEQVDVNVNTSIAKEKEEDTIEDVKRLKHMLTPLDNEYEHLLLT